MGEFSKLAVGLSLFGLEDLFTYVGSTYEDELLGGSASLLFETL